MEKLFGVEMNVLASVLFGGVVAILLIVLFMALRNRILLKLALRNIPRRKAQTVLIIVGLMLSTTIIMSALAIGDSISSSIRTVVLDVLGETDVRLRSPILARFGDDYLDSSLVERVRGEVAGDSRVDGVMPLIREQLPVLNEATSKTVAATFVVGFDVDSLGGFDGLKNIDGNQADLRSLQDGQTIINRSLSDSLDAGVGDVVTLVAPSGRSQYTVVEIVESKGIAGGDGDTRASALLPVSALQRVLGREGQYNLIEVSIQGGLRVDEQVSEDFAEELQLAFIDGDAAESIFRAFKNPVIVEALQAKLDNGGGASAGPFSSNSLEELVAELEKDSQSDEFKIAVTNTITLAIVAGVIEEIGDPELAQSLLVPMSQLVVLQVDAIKNRGLDLAELVGTEITLIFSIFGSFSIIVGLLLIFLVFVMLAASRMTEMGIIRAVGTKRRHLVQMFTYEGIVYSIGAAALGAVLGIIASVALVQIMAGVISDSDDFRFTYSVTLQSILVAFSLGLVITAVTVVISAYRVSKLNIVVAIRGLGQEFVSDETPGAGRRVKTALRWLGGPLTYAVDTWRLKRSGRGIGLRIVVFLVWVLAVGQGFLSLAASEETTEVPMGAVVGQAIGYWLIIFFWKLFKLVQPWLAAGWPLIPVGLVLALTGMHPEKGIEGLASNNAALWSVGVTLMIIGVGLGMRRILDRRGYREEFQKRVSMTFIGLAMLVFWGLPFTALDGLRGELDGGVEMFLLSGVSLVAAAVWVVMHNAEVIVWLVSKMVGPTGNLRPVVKMAIAYPMAARFRTGLTLAMFSLVIFTLMIFAILSNLGNAIEDEPDLVSGGFDIRAAIDPELPIDDANAVIAASGGELSVSDFTVIASQAKLWVEAREDGAENLTFKGARIIASDGNWLANNNFKLTHWDPEYGSTPAEIWASVATDPTLAVVAGNIVVTDDFGGGPPTEGTTFRMDGIDGDLKGEIERVEITIRPPIGQGGAGNAVRRTVIGVLDQFADVFEFGEADIYMNPGVLDQISNKPVPFDSYKFVVADPSRVGEVTRLLETAFIDHGMTARATEQDIADNQAQNNAFNQLFQGFMGLGLLVGVASLGVVSFRAVVERRQSIGMMRALGFKGRMIQIQFLMESGVVAVLGSILGIGLGTLIGWNIFNSIRADADAVTFVIPWLNVTIIVLVAVVFSLLNTLLPARQASRITPSEALRY
ncbi:MAG: FtsX-like permease family protein [Chloroflexi bacterium]|nr:FtsX-like permease family protein [Chloroflexota bacterium]